MSNSVLIKVEVFKWLLESHQLIIFRKMNRIILFAALSIGIANCYIAEADYGPKLQKLAKETHENCSEKTGATRADIERVQQGKFDDDLKIKEYTRCLWLYTKAINENFELNEKLLDETLPEQIKDEQLNVIKECREEIISKASTDLVFMIKNLRIGSSSNFVRWR
ncbi:uncharacterized protein LOC130442141 isoform X2 [Diorhabda sublineata]|uniref:uncharacterized protein LOC130442141 isoform X2 n=1 Tax=Diorhabda sublineata TaxID=1163346 RepID=UPI0024E0A648|nr:uncharacterized protein LOC130442141 isoform X2 [Diorhabda sublineata]